MTQPSDSLLPFRLKQSTFRLYEPFIDQSIRQGAITINPAPLRATTFAARLRDAIISYDKFRWPASFTSLQFDEAYKTSNLIVTHGDQTVILGPRKSKKAGFTGGATIAFNNPNDKRLNGIFVDRDVTVEEIRAICLLLTSRIISGPVIITGTASFSEETISQLESTFDVAFTTNDKKETIIL
jgi:hypothetical protein